MLFNSNIFIFGFLPLAVAGYALLGSASRAWAIRWIILASLGFYAWWRPVNVLIIAPSVAVNFLVARTLLRLRREGRVTASKAVLAAGICFNVAFLGYFKYAGFLAGASNDLLGTDWALARIILPLGISFITFQKIAFLVDVQAGRVTAFSLQDFFLFVLFFPQLIAGPIVHYREMMPQFEKNTGRLAGTDVGVGLTLFAFGLFKKVVLADGIAPLVSGVFTQAAHGQAVSLLPAWFAAVGFTFQIYFDFSGYTDMAMGVARFFGIRFPPNFNSPLKATNIIDFWMRWHMTLTRFLTAYIYNPMALALTRRRMSRGLAAFGGKKSTAGSFLALLMMPTMVTMLISGLWHGAAYTFVLWGAVHGLYITINHAWRVLVARWQPDRGRYDRLMAPIGFAVTFVAVAAAMILFRAPTLASAGVLLKGFFGLTGVALPADLRGRLGMLPAWVHSMGGSEALGTFGSFKIMTLWLLLLGSIALLCPNTLQLLADFEPALGVKPVAPAPRWAAALLRWRPTVAWAIILAAVAWVGVVHLGGKSEFLYWQF